MRAFLCPHPVRAHRVKGTPFLEDLASRYPSSQLHLRLEPPEKLPEERLYEILRRYGQLDELQALHADAVGVRQAVEVDLGSKIEVLCSMQLSNAWSQHILPLRFTDVLGRVPESSEAQSGGRPKRLRGKEGEEAYRMSVESPKMNVKTIEKPRNRL